MTKRGLQGFSTSSYINRNHYFIVCFPIDLISLDLPVWVWFRFIFSFVYQHCCFDLALATLSHTDTSFIAKPDSEFPTLISIRVRNLTKNSRSANPWRTTAGGDDNLRPRWYL
mmetsp:Transcript_13134/g.29015  ORF Transcript_13134/g.29015 Transcript_13134/m.29015 type:complete len:113 (-) Transcript_13134:88-426(-)